MSTGITLSAANLMASQQLMERLKKRLEASVPLWTVDQMLANGDQYKAQVIGLWCSQENIKEATESIITKYREYERIYRVGGVHIISAMTGGASVRTREKYGDHVDTYITCTIAVNKGDLATKKKEGKKGR